jgi:hypothetical protein
VFATLATPAPYTPDVADDEELLDYAKRAVAREHGLSERDAHRLVGTTLRELHADARNFAREVGAHDPTEAARDELGHFAGGKANMNALIRRASGRR